MKVCTSSLSLVRLFTDTIFQINIGNTLEIVDRHNQRPLEKQVFRYDARSREFAIYDYSRTVRGSNFYWSLPRQFLGNKVSISFDFKIFSENWPCFVVNIWSRKHGGCYCIITFCKITQFGVLWHIYIDQQWFRFASKNAIPFGKVLSLMAETSCAADWMMTHVTVMLCNRSQVSVSLIWFKFMDFVDFLCSFWAKIVYKV